MTATVRRPRIVKPRTAKQRAQAKRMAQRPDHVCAILPAGSGIPKTSWWLEARSREAFEAAARAQQARMQASRFARVTSFQLD